MQMEDFYVKYFFDNFIDTTFVTPDFHKSSENLVNFKGEVDFGLCLRPITLQRNNDNIKFFKLLIKRIGTKCEKRDNYCIALTFL